MVLVRKIKEQQEKLHKDLWKIVNDLRGSMQANEFRDYIFGLIMFKYLSEQLVKEVNEQLSADGITFEEALEDEEIKKELPKAISSTLGYYISPENLFKSMVNEIENGNFTIVNLQNAVNEFNESVMSNPESAKK